MGVLAAILLLITAAAITMIIGIRKRSMLMKIISIALIATAVILFMFFMRAFGA